MDQKWVLRVLGVTKAIFVAEPQNLGLLAERGMPSLSESVAIA
ncbi:hypothetical protein A2U01_0084857, partial [Trifolium medium]|nr:hypothetical protein [Trifolium medium]